MSQHLKKCVNPSLCKMGILCEYCNKIVRETENKQSLEKAYAASSILGQQKVEMSRIENVSSFPFYPPPPPPTSKVNELFNNCNDSKLLCPRHEYRSSYCSSERRIPVAIGIRPAGFIFKGYAQSGYLITPDSYQI